MATLGYDRASVHPGASPISALHRRSEKFTVLGHPHNQNGYVHAEAVKQELGVPLPPH